MVSHSRVDSERPPPPLDSRLRGNDELLDGVQVEQFELYCREMLAWNSRVNLTRVTGPDEVWTRHFLDSLSVAWGLPDGALGPEVSLIDVGSGAGLPGVPLKIAYPEVALVLLEANGKKAAFLENLVGMLGLEDARVVRSRAEDAGRRHDLREAFDVVVSRAVAPLEVLVELTLPFCKVGGVAVAQKGAGVEGEVERARNAVRLLGGGEPRTYGVTPPGSDVARSLVVVDKVRGTPERFPRRPGIPAKRPL